MNGVQVRVAVLPCDDGRLNRHGGGIPMVKTRVSEYLADRVESQLTYFDSRAVQNKRRYKTLKLTAITCNVLTTMAIALVFAVPEQSKAAMGIVALVLSTTVLATYQIEEFHNFGAKWEKFRLVAEQLKSEKFMFLGRAGRYSSPDDDLNERLFIEAIEAIVTGTAISYFLLMVEPGKRLEKRSQHLMPGE
jgi:hypothetical protein